MVKNIIQFIPLIVVLMGCSMDTPPEKYFQYYTTSKASFSNDTVFLFLNNPLKCPLRYYLTCSDSTFNKNLKGIMPLTLRAQQDTVLKIAGDSIVVNTINYGSMLGDINQHILKNKISLPFLNGKNYKVIQGYNGSYSHNIDNYSRYAIDLSLKENDTVCAADDGFVVGVIKDYAQGGDNIKFKDYANFITLYHPHSGLFTQYVHLAKNGSLVALGDTIKMRQPIGLSGKTGWTDVEHLHFNVLVPVATREGLNSTEVIFLEGYEGKHLKQNDTVKKPSISN